MPFELIQIGGWLIEVDREATQAAYLNEHPISICGCDYCQNYFAACMAHTAHSPTAVAFFQSLGIAPEKEAEVYAIYADQEKTQAYYGALAIAGGLALSGVAIGLLFLIGEAVPFLDPVLTVIASAGLTATAIVDVGGTVLYTQTIDWLNVEYSAADHEQLIERG